MANTAQRGFIQLKDCVPQQQAATNTGMVERVEGPYRQFGRIRDQKMVPFVLGIFNCILGCIQIILIIVLTDFQVKNSDDNNNPMPGDTPVLSALKQLAGGLGNFQSITWSSILLLLAGIAGILTRNKPSTAMFLFSALTGLLASLSCIGSVGFHVYVIRFRITSVLPDAPIFVITVINISMAAAGTGGSITQSVFSFRNLIDYFETKLNNVKKDEETRQRAISVAGDSNIITARRLKMAVASLGIAEIVCGLILVIVQAIPVGKVSGAFFYGSQSYLWLYAFRLHFVAGFVAGVILCISGSLGIMLSKCTFRGVLNANLAVSILAAGCSFTANVIGTNMLHPPPYIGGFPWPELIIAFSTIAVVVCIVHSSLCCKIQCQPEGEEIMTAINPPAQFSNIYSNVDVSQVHSTSSYPMHHTRPETNISVLNPTQVGI